MWALMENEMFDVNALTQQPVEAANSTQIKQCPEGEYNARIADLDGGKGIDTWFREIKTKNGDRLILSLPWMILDVGVRDKVIVYQDIWLDMSGNTLSTGEGDNVDLGRVRAALGLNTPGFSFGSLVGAGPARVKVTHDTYDPENPRAKVTRVAKVQ
jgi:hypothetical protein